MNSNNFVTLFQSVEFSKNYLQQSYEKKDIQAANELAFKNSYSFVYYIKLGDTYFHQAIQSPTTIKPVLFFYGLSHWLKAALLTVDPEYPANTQVLAHGVSTRKRKKQGYRFLSDEIKVQKDGFFPYLSAQLFQVKQLTGEKYKMRHLLMSIPELKPLFQKLEKEDPLHQVKQEKNKLISSNELLKKLRMSPKRYEQMVKEKTKSTLTCIENEDLVELNFADNIDKHFPLWKSIHGDLYIPSQLPMYWPMPEILTHFLLLYNLSMICRYEAEWWGEVLYSFSSNDLPYIETFLTCVEEKTTSLMQNILIT
ncbi:YaaC family protein [Evansella sp. AB-rgal1]|uniref:YaaC family protein n=1 Tax=Evansella sp. AB-rgal1 TaxID=3242696 RepID=UPI00359DFBC9